jgi:putative effector of murein hydrolase
MIAHPGTPLASLFCLAWTVALYFAVKPFYLRRPRIWLSPAIVVPALTIALLLAAHIPYAAYVADTRWMVWLLGPATIAFAVPIYEHRAIVRRHWLALALGVVAGTLVAMVSARLLAQAFHFNTEITRSLMARSVSTPFAVAVVSRTGGSADLVSLFTVMTGLIGMMAGDTVLALLRLRSPVAQGASLGAAAHGFGTARARQRHTEEGVVASLTMVLAGILMVIAGPALTHWITALIG